MSLKGLAVVLAAIALGCGTGELDPHGGADGGSDAVHEIILF